MSHLIDEFVTDSRVICHAHQAESGQYVEGRWAAEMTLIGLPGFLCDEHLYLSVVEPLPIVVDPQRSLDESASEGWVRGTAVDLDTFEPGAREAAEAEAALAAMLFNDGQPLVIPRPDGL